MISKSISTLVLVAIVATTTTTAWAATNLQPDTPITGTLASAQTILEWQFTGERGEWINLDLTADFDSYLTISRPSGKIVAAADDGWDSLVSGISSFELPIDGTYIVKLGSYNRGGSYSLTLTGDYSTTLATAGGQISSGEQKKIMLGKGGVKYYFKGQKDTYLTLKATKTNEGVDPRLSLFNSKGESLISDDDGAGNLNAEIWEYKLPETDEYTISLQSNSTSGEITLTAITADAVTPAKSLPFGERQRSTLIDGGSERWSFVGKSNQTIQLRASSNVADIKIALKDQDGNELGNDDDSGGNNNALISEYTLPADATYTVVVSAYSNDLETVNYSVLLREVKPTIESSDTAMPNM